MEKENLIFKLMRDAGMTQAQLAAEVGVHPSFISMYFSGKRSLGKKTILRIHELFPEIDLKYLMR